MTNKIVSEMKNKEGFADYQKWKDDQMKRAPEKVVAPSVGNKKHAVSKKVLVQYRFDNSGDKIAQLNIYLCWLLCWCGTLAYQDPEERDFLVHQAIEVLKKMVYRVDPNPTIEVFEIMMDSAFQHGDENMVRLLFEIYSEEFKMQQNQTMIQLMLKALGKSTNLAKKNVTDIKEERSTIKTEKVLKEEERLSRWVQ